MIDNATTGAVLYAGTTLVPLGGISNSQSLGIFGPVDVKVSSDDKKVGVAGETTVGTNTYPAFRIWYNE